MSQNGRPEPPPPRVVIDAVRPEVDSGRYPAKTTVGERFRVTAHAYADGHDLLQVELQYRPSGDEEWRRTLMTAEGNDEWSGEFRADDIGAHEYTVIGWIDHFASWLADLEKRVEAGWDITPELQEGAALLRTAGERAEDHNQRVALRGAAAWLEDSDLSLEQRLEVARDPEIHAAATAARDRSVDTAYWRALPLWVDREKARFSTWYEMFPRSATPDPGRSATLREAAERLPDLEAMGFDVVYLPPIHPIGTTDRKGANNTLNPQPGEPGSPWAIGSSEGGHMAVHPDLGTIDDFKWFLRRANGHGLEVALDLAFQCSPDHPWVTEHPEWFRHRPDGSIRFAENPPKQYQDIYPINFETPDWKALWSELLRVTLFWVERGVKIFRVDNPHTKPFPFWEWLIRSVHANYPDVIFLAEAFTRPKRMAGLAKLGFSQSYSYFTWRNTKQELTEYLGELTRPPLSDVMRANFFANTPDILHEYLQQGGRAAFLTRLALAATLGPSYGIYSGYELIERTPVAEGSEEYLDSEKFQLRPRDWDAPGNIKAEITRLNELRRQYPALQHNHELWFLPIQNDQVIAYIKSDPTSVDSDGGGGAAGQRPSGHILTVVSLDPSGPQSGWVGVPLDALGLRDASAYAVRELLTDQRYTWTGEWNSISLTPEQPAQVFAFEGPLSDEDPGGIVLP